MAAERGGESRSVAELLVVVGLYALWEAVPRRGQRFALSWFWIGILLLAAAGMLYTVLDTGTMPAPPGEL